MNALFTKPRLVLVSGCHGAGDTMEGISRYARERSWRLVLDATPDGSALAPWRGDGQVVCNHTGLPAQTGEACPSVALGLEAASSSGPRVVPDAEAAALLAVNHLMERGYRQFAWAPLANDAGNASLCRAFDRALGDYGLSALRLPAWLPSSDTGSEGDWRCCQERLVRELARLPRGVGILAYNDRVALEIRECASSIGRQTPGDLAILGIGNDPVVAGVSGTSLSSIELDGFKMGYEAARLLDALMAGDGVAESTVKVAPRGVLDRLSTGFQPVKDERVRAALVYVTENYMNFDLGVQDVANAAGVSRRSLERLFRLELRSTVSEAINSRRLKEAARLLRSSDRVKVSNVAELVGFAGAANFFRRFRRAYGVTPKAYTRKREDSGVLLGV